MSTKLIKTCGRQNLLICTASTFSSSTTSILSTAGPAAAYTNGLEGSYHETVEV
jgi:hypothetical protein